MASSVGFTRLSEETDCGHPEADRTSGMVAYLDGAPVGWVAVEPRADDRQLRGSPVPWVDRTEVPDDPNVWAIACSRSGPVTVDRASRRCCLRRTHSGCVQQVG